MVNKAKQINMQELKSLHSMALNLADDLEKLGINTVDDLLWYFPYRYDDLSQITKVSDINPDTINTVAIQITKLRSYRSFRAKMTITELVGQDDSGSVEAIWFRQKFVSQILKVGDKIYLSGKVKQKNDNWQFVSPSYEKIKEENIHSGRLVPIYHLSGKITQKQLRFLISKAIKENRIPDDPLPVDILNKEKFPWLFDSLKQIHFPDDEKKLKAASQRLKFEELFYLQLKYQLAKQNYQAKDSYQVKLNDNLTNQIIKDLPFKLTLDQQKALYDILADLEQKKPMNRLLEGDVGSGKTIVSLIAALNTASQDFQVALMAPTEILASQHFTNIQKILPAKYWESTAILTKNNYATVDNKKISKASLIKKISKGEIKIIIGTHALIQEKINFKNLALAIIDEQHRFGVQQRKKLKDKNPDDKVPHLLSMTATPIPRTLTLTLYGDLDISIIKEKPAGRKEIKTFLVPERKRKDAYKFIKEKINHGQQAFVICPLIDESDKLGVKSVTKEYEKLNKNVFPDLEIQMLHGKLKNEVKEKIMDDFKKNKFPVLVATSVIEVGVDIPGATMMIIESAERFGLSQLHQFRGRIGRNDQESYCLLFSTDQAHDAKRLQALTKTNDGFELAELDLQLRGAGDVFGTRQTGLIKLKIAKLSDTKLIKKAQDWARHILADAKYLKDKNLQSIVENLKNETHLE